MKICFTVDGKKHCIEIPVLMEYRPFPDPDPGPYRKWIDLDKDLAGDLVALATIDAAATLLADPSIRRQLQGIVGEIAAGFQKQLPKGISVQPSQQARG